MKYIIGISLAIVSVAGIAAAYFQMGYEPVVAEKPIVTEEKGRKKIVSESDHATLPLEFEKLPSSKVGDMKVGETAYARSWSMFVDKNRKIWLNPNDRIWPKVQPSVMPWIKITRTKAGYEVESLDKDEKWRILDFDGNGSLYIPVRKFTGYKDK